MLLFVNDLTVMDFSYLCPERGVVGESWIVDVVLDGDLNDESMVLDFGLVKKQLKRLIDDHVDHKLVVPVENPITKLKHTDDERVLVDFERPDNLSIHLNCPADAYAFVYSDKVTMESVSEYLPLVIKKELPVNVQGLQLSLREEVINTPYYHYSHGLKKHDGNCQRIAHGHRSKIVIEKDGARDSSLEQQWSERWQDIYIGTKEDIVELKELILGQSIKDKELSDHWSFSYQADQGIFQLLIPKAECEIVETDSTVECLAEYIAAQLKIQHPQSSFKVWAFEGVGKGAIAFN